MTKSLFIFTFIGLFISVMALKVLFISLSIQSFTAGDYLFSFIFGLFNFLLLLFLVNKTFDFKNKLKKNLQFGG